MALSLMEETYQIHVSGRQRGRSFHSIDRYYLSIYSMPGAVSRNTLSHRRILAVWWLSNLYLKGDTQRFFQRQHLQDKESGRGSIHLGVFSR